jgi:hypothetical protein
MVVVLDRVLTVEDVPEGVVDGGEHLPVAEHTGWPSLQIRSVNQNQFHVMRR